MITTQEAILALKYLERLNLNRYEQGQGDAWAAQINAVTPDVNADTFRQAIEETAANWANTGRYGYIDASNVIKTINENARKRWENFLRTNPLGADKAPEELTRESWEDAQQYERSFKRFISAGYDTKLARQYAWGAVSPATRETLQPPTKLQQLSNQALKRALNK